jgi:sodium-dependent dicarboxylate transporter 2/3/5
MEINSKNLIAFIITPLVSIGLILFFDFDPQRDKETTVLAIALLMAVWWVTEAIPIAATALIPVALFPLFGVMKANAVAGTYFNQVIFLFIGGFIIALAMQKWQLHRRIALSILMKTGISPRSILLGFMLATSFLSMWISNTATAMLMVPILLSLIESLSKYIDSKQLKPLSVALFLGVAYSASVGGLSTLIGTPPNLSFSRIYEIYFPDAEAIGFSQWMFLALPVSIIMFIMVYLVLYFLFVPKKSIEKVNVNFFAIEKEKLGKASVEERIVFMIFIVTAILWISRSDIRLSSFTIPGWGSLFPHKGFISDGSIAMFMSLLLFILPSKQKNIRLMTWGDMRDLPWNIVLLFGGGFALASGFKESGLSLYLGEQLHFATNFHPLILIFTISLFMTFLTELTSNTATTEMILPVLAGIAVVADIDPLMLMVPATMSASMAFMLPVATPPNAIIFGTNRIRMKDMVRAGIILNIIGAITIALVCWLSI